MNLETLKTYVGRSAIWKPKLRSNDIITIPVVIEAVQQRYARDEARVHPVHGTGAAWVSVASLKIVKQ